MYRSLKAVLVSTARHVQAEEGSTPTSDPSSGDDDVDGRTEGEPDLQGCVDVLIWNSQCLYSSFVSRAAG